MLLRMPSDFAEDIAFVDFDGVDDAREDYGFVGELVEQLHNVRGDPNILNGCGFIRC